MEEGALLLPGGGPEAKSHHIGQFISAWTRGLNTDPTTKKII